MRKMGDLPKNRLGQPHPDPVKSTINVRRSGEHAIKIDFTEPTGGRGLIHLYYAGSFVKTIRVNLITDMEERGN